MSRLAKRLHTETAYEIATISCVTSLGRGPVGEADRVRELASEARASSPLSRPSPTESSLDERDLDRRPKNLSRPETTKKKESVYNE